MRKPRVLVTGAAGKTGSLVVAELPKAGYPVRAMVHQEDRRSARLKALGAETAVADMSDVERIADALVDVQSAYFVPTPAWLFMKSARLAGLPIDLMSGVRYYIDDHKRGAFELGAPTSDVLDVTGYPAEDFETIARRYAALPSNQRTLGNYVQQLAQLLIAPSSPRFDLDRYDRELRCPFPSEPQFARESKIWRIEHAILGQERAAIEPGLHAQRA